MGDESKGRGDGARILIVEDNDDYRLLLTLAFRDAGYVVDAAACAEDAARLLRSRHYGLVLSDYTLPVHSGGWLRSQAISPHGHPIPFVIVTGYPDAPGIPRDAVVMRKPIDFDRLLDVVRRLAPGHKTKTSGAPAGSRPPHGVFSPFPIDAPPSASASA